MNEDGNFEIWEDGVPVVIQSSTTDFDVWENGVLVEDQQVQPDDNARRRVGSF